MAEVEKGEGSFYKPYLDTLPHVVDGLPIDFSEEEKALLKGSSLLNDVNVRLENMKADFDLLRQHVPLLKDKPFAEFKRYRNIISSRVFGIKVDGVKTGGMVPYADMINHKFPKMSEWNYEDSRAGFVLKSIGPLDRGLELFDSYGKKCNSKFFLSYGFLEDNNDSTQYSLHLLVNSHNIRRFDDKLARCKLDLPKLRLTACMDFEDDTMVHCMRFALAESEEDLSALASYFDFCCIDSERVYSTPPLSIPNELEVLAAIRQLCTSRLAQYDTSPEEDGEILGRKSLSYNERLCVQYRCGEKLILRHMADLHDTVARLFALSAADVSMLMKHYPYARYRQYIEAAVLPLVQRQQRQSSQL